MSCALEIKRDESPAAADGLALSDFWLLPLLLLVQVVVRFSRHLAKLKAMRRTRPMPKDWKSFYPELRRCEWAIHKLVFAGARQIILGQDLDLAALGHDPEPPESFQPPMPRSALAMHRRMEDIARFHADPEGFIRRCANRIRARTCGPGGSNPSNFHSGPNPDPSNFAAAPSCLSGRNGAVEVFLFFSPDVFWAPAAPAGERIRAPPGFRLPTADCPLPRDRVSENERLCLWSQTLLKSGCRFCANAANASAASADLSCRPNNSPSRCIC